jgi:hypothetical protein
MATERKRKLDALPWWLWDVFDDTWNARFAELVSYHTEHGRIPAKRGSGLGVWVANQRSTRETMAKERKERLDMLTWWKWNEGG